MSEFSALVLSLPTRNSTLRMRIWRALKDSGCGALRDGVYLLPEGSAGVLSGMEADIRAHGGYATTLMLKTRSEAQLGEFRKLFDRGADYGALVKRIEGAKGALARLGSRRAQTEIRRLEK